MTLTLLTLNCTQQYIQLTNIIHTHIHTIMPYLNGGFRNYNNWFNWILGNYHQTQSEYESVYTLEIKRVELKPLYVKAKQAYDAIQGISRDTHKTIKFKK